jgi:hypothetical protein
MTIEQVVCVCFGFIFEALTFGLGIAVGVSLCKRKEPDHGDSSIGSLGKNQCRSAGCGRKCSR